MSEFHDPKNYETVWGGFSENAKSFALALPLIEPTYGADLAYLTAVADMDVETVTALITAFQTKGLISKENDAYFADQLFVGYILESILKLK